jgi:TDG/mug DNA glycosylase family protein
MERDTVAVYEARAEEWRARRSARYADRAAALAGLVEPGTPTADLGSGPGQYLAHLGRPAVAVDAAIAMLRLAAEATPDVPGVQADLELLPFRRGVLGGAWARASYVHVPAGRLPLALADLHRAMRPGAPARLTMMVGDGDGPFPGDDFPGRVFTRWQPDVWRDVLLGAGFELEAFEEDPGEGPDRWMDATVRRARTLPDFVAPDMRILVCGLNPSLYAADRGIGFARPGNRFWPAALAAGVVSRDRDPTDALLGHGVGMTDLVKRATSRADELTRAEYVAGAARVERLAARLRPRVVCFVGLAGYRAAVDRQAVAGLQPLRFGGVAAYVMPNPSGVNAHATVASLTDHLRAVASLARSV